MSKRLFHEDAELNAKILNAEPEIQDYVVALQSENRRLQKKVAQLQAKNRSAKNRVTAAPPKHSKRRDHNVDMPGLMKLMFGERPADPSSPTL